MSPFKGENIYELDLTENMSLYAAFGGLAMDSLHLPRE